MDILCSVPRKHFDNRQCPELSVRLGHNLRVRVKPRSAPVWQSSSSCLKDSSLAREVVSVKIQSLAHPINVDSTAHPTLLTDIPAPPVLHGTHEFADHRSRNRTGHDGNRTRSGSESPPPKSCAKLGDLAIELGFVAGPRHGRNGRGLDMGNAGVNPCSRGEGGAA